MHFDDHELRSPEGVEQIRRSIVMLQPGDWALRREEAERVLAALGEALDAARRPSV